MRALNIEVPRELVARWCNWFAPDRQPFLVGREFADALCLSWERSQLPAELRDTFEVYQLPDLLGFVWLDEHEFLSLSRANRSTLVRAQLRHGREQVPSVRAWSTLIGSKVRQHADGHRFVWWPSLLKQVAEPVLRDYVEQGRRPSRHDEVPTHVWDSAAEMLPAARSLAGRFPATSGPNCFATVMAAAGIPGAAAEWMQREPFEDWLAGSTRPGGTDARQGTVMVWRSSDGLAQHAAVTLGQGWAMHKPSQGWFDPVKVLFVDDLKRSARTVGHRLHRYALVG